MRYPLIALVVFAAVSVGATQEPAAPAVAAPAAPAASPETLAAYKKHCQPCHQANGDMKLMDMSFVDGKWKHGTSVKEIAKVIADGVPTTPMMPFKGKLTEAEVLALARYVRAFDKQLKPETP